MIISNMNTEITRLMGKSIFISKKLQIDSPFQAFDQTKDFKIIDEALIKISQIRFSYTPKTKWIFFSSKNAIKHFFEQEPEIAADVYFAVISPVSANYLITFGKTATFIGEGVDIIKIAKDFRDTLKNDSVLFPQAIDSIQTIQKQLSFTNTCHNLYVYKTVIRADFDIPYSEIVIFTSPSNVKAYLSKYKISTRQTVIAIGGATKNTLKTHGISNVLTPNSFDEKGLFDVLTNNEVKY